MSDIRVKYTDEEKARAAVHLIANEENARKTAKDLNMPLATLRRWKKTWKMNGYPHEVDKLIPTYAESFITAAIELRWLMIDKLKERVEDGGVNARDLLYGINSFTDKINLMSGLATSRTEKVNTIPQPEELAKVIAAYVGDTVDSAINRNQEIEDSQGEQARPALSLIK